MRKLRTGLTTLAIVLGVAMISGAYVLMDTTLNAFNGIFATAYSKAQVGVGLETAVIRGHDQIC